MLPILHSTDGILRFLFKCNSGGLLWLRKIVYAICFVPCRLGGVELVLNSLKIDQHSPALQQWAVFAVRNLTDDNLSVQRRIAELKLQGLDEESVEQLERTGMRSKIEDEIQRLVEERSKSERGGHASASASSSANTRTSELGCVDNLFELKSADIGDGDDGGDPASTSSRGTFDSLLSDMGLSHSDIVTSEEEEELTAKQVSSLSHEREASACSADTSRRVDDQKSPT